jgi:hypothetical protein
MTRLLPRRVFTILFPNSLVTFMVLLAQKQSDISEGVKDILLQNLGLFIDN